jgi:hypothetical protein
MKRMCFGRRIGFGRRIAMRVVGDLFVLGPSSKLHCVYTTSRDFLDEGCAQEYAPMHYSRSCSPSFGEVWPNDGKERGRIRQILGRARRQTKQDDHLDDICKQMTDDYWLSMYFLEIF